MDVALVTCAALPGLWPDDRLLLRALRARGIHAEPVVWEDRYFDWSTVRLSVIRSTWDYSYRRTAFLSWAERVAERTTLWNSESLVRWNTHKQYLCDLAAANVPTVPTVVLHRGAKVRVSDVLAEHQWNHAIIKAAVAQAGRYLLRVSVANVSEGQAHLDRLLPHEDLLVQPYLPAVQEAGELSLVFVAGDCTHAVRKRVPQDDIRVHSDFGGSCATAIPHDADLRTADSALAVLTEEARYARVDIVIGLDEMPCVMELELVEPELFFGHSGHAVERMVETIVEYLGDRA